ncbi:MAG: hypothetical protein B6U69_04195 [Thermofilum sp. ex4484_15]|nr:MAG: hypothetical protein B6U69_04195 [Thermofilum sp. ex4484_15]
MRCLSHDSPNYLNLRNIFLATLASVTGSFAFRLSMPVVAYYYRFVLEASATLVGVLTAIYFIGRAPLAALAGHLYKGQGSLRFSAFCFAMVAVLMPFYLSFHDIPGILMIRFVQGALLGYAWTIVQIIVGSSTPKDLRATIYAIYFLAGSASLPLANTVYVLLSSRGPSFLLFLSSAFFLVTGILVWFMKYVKVVRVRERRMHKEHALLMGSLATYMLLLRLSTAFTTGDIIYVYLCEIYGLGKEGAVALLAMVSALSMGISVPLNFIADKFSEDLVIYITGTLTTSGIILFSTNNLTSASLGLSLLLIGARSLTPLSRRVALTYVSYRGVGYIGAAGNVGVLASNLIVGVVYDLLSINNVTWRIFNPLIIISAPMALALTLNTSLLLIELKKVKEESS